MKIGNIRPQGEFLADTWQRIYSHEVGINEGFDTYDKLAINFDGTDGATSHTAKTGQTITFAGRAQLDTAQSKFGTASLLLNGGGIDVYTKLCSHFDGAHGATSYSDPIAGAYTFYDAAQLSTSVKHFGTASLFLNGTGDYVTLPDSSSWSFGTGDFTIDFWIRFSDTTGAQAFISQYQDDNNYWYCYKDGDNRLGIYFISGGVVKGNYITTSVVSLSGGQWYHFAFIRNGSNCLIFVDGVSKTLTTSTSFSTNDVGDVSGVLKVGTYGTYYTLAWIDELRISKGTARWTSNFTVPTIEYGTGDYVTIPDSDDWNFGTGDFTIDCWVRSASTDYQTIMGQKEDSTLYMYLDFNISLGTITFFARNAGTTHVLTGTTTLNVSTWYHIAIVRSSGVGKVYVNGLDITTSDSLTTFNIPNYVGVLNIGQGGWGDYFNGWIDEFRISKGTARWTSNFTPPTAAYGVTSLTISGLDGDTEEEYILRARVVCGFAQSVYVQPNGDTNTSNYGTQRLYGSNTTVAANRTVNGGIIRIANDSGVGHINLSDTIIYAKSGFIRTAISTSNNDVDTTTIGSIDMYGGSWNNTANNITSLVILSSATGGLGVGTIIELYARKSKV